MVDTKYDRQLDFAGHVTPHLSLPQGFPPRALSCFTRRAKNDYLRSENSPVETNECSLLTGKRFSAKLYVCTRDVRSRKKRPFSEFE